MKQAVLEQKQAVVAEISDRLKSSESAVVVEYRGLSVAEVTELREALRAEEVEMTVYKNKMVQRACDDAGFGDLKEQLTGPNALVFGKDAVAPSRVLAKFAKSHGKLILKGAVVEGKVVGIDTINELATLPNKEGMLSMLLSCLQSPVRSFALAVQAVADLKGEASSVTEEVTAPVVEETTTEAAEAAAE